MQSGGQQNNSSQGLELAYYVGGLIVVFGYLWYQYHAKIVEAVLNVQLYQAYAMIFPLGLAVEVAQDILPAALAAPIILLTQNLAAVINDIHSVNYADVTFTEMTYMIGRVGSYFAAYTCPIWLAIAVYIQTAGVATAFDEKYKMEEFRRKESVNWPPINTVLGTKLLASKLDEGEFAMCMQPMEFAKKHKLLDVQIAAGRPIANVNRSRAHQHFVTQMGPRWEGNLQHFPPYIIALFAIFAAKANHDTKGAAALMRRVSESSYHENKKLDFSGSFQLLGKHIQSMKVARAVGAHAYLLPAMASMLEAARDDGVIATAEFLWLKPTDRRMWYMLNSVGRQVAFTEVGGPFAHWRMEKRLRRPLKTPMVDEAITALEIGVSEIIYKPDEGQ